MTSGPGTHEAGSDDLARTSGDVGGPSERSLTRREVLRGLAASGLTVGLVGSVAAACTDGGDRGSPDGDSETAEAEEAIVRIGRRYREERPDEDDRAVLLDRLGAGAGAEGSPELLSSLDEQVAEDYAAGRTVLLDGWVLSLTEGRAAALVSLA